ncbi:MAG: hypothetical protein QME94_04105 [Anaerolineae bacterium]|nr:hypothetical protein [Anaerolineae bacterium]
MAQAIVCYNHEGLVLATDSLEWRELEGGRVERLTERKLFALGARAAILTSGAPVGVELCVQLSDWLQARRLSDLDDVLTVSRDFLSEGYARYLRANHGDGEGSLAAARHLYFVIGGYSGRAGSPSVALLLRSEAGELPLEQMRLGRVFTLPRRLTLEARMRRQIAEGTRLRGLVESCWSGLEALAERNPECVGGSFLVATVTADGVEISEHAPGGPEAC